MARKYHWSYEAAMRIVDDWCVVFSKTANSDAYESLVQSIANELERQREVEKAERRRQQPTPYAELPSPLGRTRRSPYRWDVGTPLWVSESR